TPNNPAIRFARGTVFAATLVRDCYGLSGCWPPCTDLTSLPANGGFYFQAFDGSVTLPVAGYNYNSVWTPLLTGLSPAGMAASLADLIPPLHECPPTGGSHGKPHRATKILGHARCGGGVAARGARAAAGDAGGRASRLEVTRRVGGSSARISSGPERKRLCGRGQRRNPLPLGRKPNGSSARAGRGAGSSAGRCDTRGWKHCGHI